MKQVQVGDKTFFEMPNGDLVAKNNFNWSKLDEAERQQIVAKHFPKFEAIEKQEREAYEALNADIDAYFDKRIKQGGKAAANNSSYTLMSADKKQKINLTKGANQHLTPDWAELKQMLIDFRDNHLSQDDTLVVSLVNKALNIEDDTNDRGNINQIKALKKYNHDSAEWRAIQAKVDAAVGQGLPYRRIGFFEVYESGQERQLFKDIARAASHKEWA